MAEYSLRPAQEEDYKFLFALHETTMRPYIEATWGWHDDWQEEYFRRKFEPRHRKVIQVNGQDAGVLVVEDRPFELYLGLIEVLPAFQGHGLGLTIVQDLQKQAAVTHRPLALHVLKSNDGARRLYMRLGFTKYEEEEHRLKMIWSPGPQ